MQESSHECVTGFDFFLFLTRGVVCFIVCCSFWWVFCFIRGRVLCDGGFEWAVRSVTLLREGIARHMIEKDGRQCVVS